MEFYLVFFLIPKIAFQEAFMKLFLMKFGSESIDFLEKQPLKTLQLVFV